MAETMFTADELAALFDEGAKPADSDELAALLGEGPAASTVAPSGPNDGLAQLLESLAGDTHSPLRSQPDVDGLRASQVDDNDGVADCVDAPESAAAGAAAPLNQDHHAAPVAEASSSPTQPAQTEYAWENAHHLVPAGLLPLVRRYPPISLSQHPEHGLVIVAAYLEDKGRHIRRNFKFGNDTFFYAPELEVIEPDTGALDCRIVIKTFRHEPGMRIRYWQNTPNGDAPGKSGTLEVTERGLRRLSGPKAGR